MPTLCARFLRLLLGVAVVRPSPVAAAPAVPDSAQALRKEADELTDKAERTRDPTDFMRAGAKWAELLEVVPENPANHKNRFFYCDQATYVFIEAASKQPGVREPLTKWEKVLQDYLASLGPMNAESPANRDYRQKASQWLTDVREKLAALPPEAPVTPQPIPPQDNPSPSSPESIPDSKVDSSVVPDRPPRWPVAGLATSGIVLGLSASALLGLALVNAHALKQAKSAEPPRYDELTAKHHQYDNAFLAMIVVSSAAVVATTAFAIGHRKKTRASTVAAWVPGGAVLRVFVRF